MDEGWRFPWQHCCSPRPMPCSCSYCGFTSGFRRLGPKLARLGGRPFAIFSSRARRNSLDLFELTKTVGALAAIPTAIFVFFDRIVRGRPLVSLTVKDEPIKESRYLTITNTGKTDIAIRRITVRPPIYGTTKGNSLEEIYHAAIGARLRSLIGPGDTAAVQLIAIHQGQRYHEQSDHWVCIVVHWRKTSSFWFPQFPVITFTSTKTMRELIASA